jgi:hypothetical protein
MELKYCRGKIELKKQQSAAFRRQGSPH